jgi:hypothetical protein
MKWMPIVLTLCGFNAGQATQITYTLEFVLSEIRQLSSR